MTRQVTEMARRRRISAATAAALVALLVTSGCGRDRVTAPPRPVDTSPPSTIARAQVGDRLIVTAAVEQIVDDAAIVVRDVDLTGGTLLVLTTEAGEASPPELVTVEGIVVLFSYRDLAGRHRLGDPDGYGAFEGQKALAAVRVTLWR